MGRVWSEVRCLESMAIVGAYNAHIVPPVIRLLTTPPTITGRQLGRVYEWWRDEAYRQGMAWIPVLGWC
jgi:hypothetical protein